MNQILYIDLYIICWWIVTHMSGYLWRLLSSHTKAHMMTKSSEVVLEVIPMR